MFISTEIRELTEIPSYQHLIFFKFATDQVKKTQEGNDLKVRSLKVKERQQSFMEYFVANNDKK